MKNVSCLNFNRPYSHMFPNLSSINPLSIHLGVFSSSFPAPTSKRPLQPYSMIILFQIPPKVHKGFPYPHPHQYLLLFVPLIAGWAPFYHEWAYWTLYFWARLTRWPEFRKEEEKGYPHAAKGMLVQIIRLTSKPNANRPRKTTTVKVSLLKAAAAQILRD